MANRTEVSKVIGLLLDAYPAREIHNLTGFVDVAARVLRDVPAGRLQRAAEQHIAECAFFPAISELQRKAMKLSDLPVSGQVKPMEPLLRNYVEEIQRFEFLRPEEWSTEDHALFRRLMGRAVKWESEPAGAPWMAWKSDLKLGVQL
jgi:hypothetical protein